MKSKFERKLEKVKEAAIKENIPIIMDETLANKIMVYRGVVSINNG